MLSGPDPSGLEPGLAITLSSATPTVSRESFIKGIARRVAQPKCVVRNPLNLDYASGKRRTGRGGGGLVGEEAQGGANFTLFVPGVCQTSDSLTTHCTLCTVQLVDRAIARRMRAK